MSATKEHNRDKIKAGMRTSSQSPLPLPTNRDRLFTKWDETHAASLPLQREYPRNEGEGFKTTPHKIQWLNLPGYKGETWNPIIGCSKVSEGCRNCYAEKMAVRISGMELAQIFKRKKLSELPTKYNRVMNGNKWNGKTWFVNAQIDKPLKWKSPRVVFVCSMGDLFHKYTSFAEIDNVFSIMACNPQHIFIVLTKRAKRMAEYFEDPLTRSNISYNILHDKNNGYAIEDPLCDDAWPLKNVWMGVSVENQKAADERIPYLLQVSAAVRLVSIEPMLGPVDLNRGFCYESETAINFLTGEFLTNPHQEEPSKGNHKLDWVICGGESGHHARPMHPDWVRSLRNQCQAAGVPFFFKQWGEYIPAMQIPKEWGHPADVKGKHSWVNYADGEDTCEGIGEMTIKVGKHKSGNLLDGVKYEEYPSFDSAQDDSEISPSVNQSISQ